MDSILRWPQVKAATGLSRTTVWRLEKSDNFPKRRQLGVKSVGWLETQISAWLASRDPVSNPIRRSK